MNTEMKVTPLEAKRCVQEYFGQNKFNGVNPSNILLGAIYPSGREDVCVLTHEQHNGSGKTVKELVCVYRKQNGTIWSRIFFKTGQACSIKVDAFDFFEQAVRIHFTIVPQSFSRVEKMSENIAL